MRVSARVMNDVSFQDDPVAQDLGLIIEHNDKLYTLSEDNHGHLIFRCVHGNLLIRPEGANSIEIDSEI